MEDLDKILLESYSKELGLSKTITLEMLINSHKSLINMLKISTKK